MGRSWRACCSGSVWCGGRRRASDRPRANLGAAAGGQQRERGGIPLASWDELVGLVHRLRSPDGCPWDREQTHLSLRRFALEEAREVVAAIDAGDMHALADELGDLLLQVLLHAEIAAEEGVFSLADVIDGLAAKLVRRHPHVFGEGPEAVRLGTSDEVRRSWEEIKRRERDDGTQGLLDDVSRAQPALAEAQQLGKRAAGVGFDWPSAGEAWEKVLEETREVGAELRQRSEAVEEELGDLLFALVNVARLSGLDAEAALVGANDKFRRRFAAIEAGARRGGRELATLSLDEMETLWQAAKGGSREAP